MSFALGKIAWLLAKPSTMLALLLLAGFAWRLLRGRGRGRAAMAAALGCAALLAALPIGLWLIAPLENRFPIPRLPARVDGIVVLGGSIQSWLSENRGTLALNANAERLVAFAALARRYPDAKLVFTGGSGSIGAPAVREGDLVGAFLDAVGLPRARVLIDRESRNTIENARYAKALAQPKAGETWVLITSARHMPRSVGVFRAQGWPVLAYPVDYVTPRQVSLDDGFDPLGGLAAADEAAYEWYGLVFYRLTGRIEALFPGP